MLVPELIVSVGVSRQLKFQISVPLKIILKYLIRLLCSAILKVVLSILISAPLKFILKFQVFCASSVWLEFSTSRVQTNNPQAPPNQYVWRTQTGTRRHTWRPLGNNNGHSERVVTEPIHVWWVCACRAYCAIWANPPSSRRWGQFSHAGLAGGHRDDGHDHQPWPWTQHPPQRRTGANLTQRTSGHDELDLRHNTHDIGQQGAILCWGGVESMYRCVL